MRILSALGALATGFVIAGCASNGLVVETVVEYGPIGSRLPNSHADGDGFIAALTPPDGNDEWRVLARWKDPDVWDTDFLDQKTWDESNFDQPGAAISFFSGHGLTGPYGESPPHRCSHSSECKTPPPQAGPRGICKAAGTPGHAVGDTSQCVYYNDRSLVTFSSKDQFGHVANYSGGRAKWGESKNSGPWAGAGTDGGTNLVVLDSSWGVLASFWYEQTHAAMAGVHFLATTLPVTGDYLNDPQRGAAFGKRWAQDSGSSVSQSWLVAMNAIPGGGFDMSGCHFVIAYDESSERALKHLDEDWSELKNDGWDAKGNAVYWARWLCNWTSQITDDTIFELK
ncbi:hypothetical protein Q4S45_22910 [Massilia sp. R2A-15]|uniref:hypothetical protein n=1 Tax=Massilia sp. R2A-15 TaxID=3064278 RepID=UPI0027355235|nr:hypothetical protein [Massilia sp. R2A-15]WLI89505.1 hypothetical protein Q4S45_22910 [Massilia sp. R2A-15]